MNNWWHPNSWWSPKDVTNPKSYILHIYLSTKGRIGVGTWFWFWLYLTIIFVYFYYRWISMEWSGRDNFMSNCTGRYDYWNAGDNDYHHCDQEYTTTLSTPLFNDFILVWLLLLYPYWAISVKRFHDIGYNSLTLVLCIIGSIFWGIGALVYLYYMCKASSIGYGPVSTEAKKYGMTLATFRQMWNFESKEIQTASKWEKQRGYNEAIQIHRNLGRMGDVNRLEKAHIIYLWEKFISKKTSMESQGVICKSLISPENFSIIIENSKYKDELSDIISMSSSK